MATANHTGRKDIAIKIHHALAIAVKRSAALKLAIKQISILGQMLGYLGIGDWQIFGTIKTKALDGFLDPMFAAKKNWMAITGIVECQRSTDHPLFFTLGKDDALFIGTDAFENRLQGTCGWIKTRR